MKYARWRSGHELTTAIKQVKSLKVSCRKSQNKAQNKKSITMTGSVVLKGAKKLTLVLCKIVLKKRLGENRIFYSRGSTIAYFADMYMEERNDIKNHMIRRGKVSDLDLFFNFNKFTNLECFTNFRFCKRNIYCFISAMSWSA